MMWSEKYRPARAIEMVGNEEARISFLGWLTDWEVGTKPILFIGPPGTGKTTLVRAAVKELGYDMVEMNASDARTKERLEQVIPPVLSNAGVMGRKMLLFLDEVDGLSGRGDRGGLATLVSLLKEPTVPVVMAANAEVGEQIKELKKLSTAIRFKRIPPRLLLLYLDRVLQAESAKMSLGDRIRLVTLCAGDVRSLLNGAQSLATAGLPSLPTASFSEPIEYAINSFFAAESLEDALTSLQRSEGFYNDPRFPGYDSEKRRTDKLAALFSSIVTSGLDVDKLASLLTTLAKTDQTVGRMSRSREWRLLRYIDGMLAYGLFEGSRNLAYNQYDIPFALMNRVFREARSIREINSALARKLHTSRHVAAIHYLPYLLMILKGSKIDAKEFLAANGMDASLEDILKVEVQRVGR